MRISRTASENVERRAGGMKAIAGVILLIISVPVFLLYKYMPTINAQIGPHQIASWIAVTLSFIGFMLLIIGAGEMDV